MQTALIIAIYIIIILFFIYSMKHKQMQKKVRQYMRKELDAIWNETMKKIDDKKRLYLSETDAARQNLQKSIDEFENRRDEIIDKAKTEAIEGLYRIIDEYVSEKYTSKQSRDRINRFITVIKEKYQA